MKDYIVTAIINGAERTFHVSAYDWIDAQGQVDKAYRGHLGYEGAIVATELSTLPGTKDTPPTTQERPGVYQTADTKYWDYMREDIRCYDSISSSALAAAFETIQDKGCYTTSQIATVAMVIEDTVSRTAAIQGLTL